MGQGAYRGTAGKAGTPEKSGNYASGLRHEVMSFHGVSNALTLTTMNLVTTRSSSSTFWKNGKRKVCRQAMVSHHKYKLWTASSKLPSSASRISTVILSGRNSMIDSLDCLRRFIGHLSVIRSLRAFAMSACIYDKAPSEMPTKGPLPGCIMTVFPILVFRTRTFGSHTGCKMAVGFTGLRESQVSSSCIPQT